MTAFHTTVKGFGSACQENFQQFSFVPTSGVIATLFLEVDSIILYK
jgi:hypothetical protein